MPVRAALTLIAAIVVACAGPSPSATPTITAAQPTPSPPSPVAPTSPPSTATSPPSPTGGASPTGTAGEAPTPTATPAAPPDAIALEPIADGFEPLVLLTHAGDGSGQVYAVEQPGVVRVGSTAGAFAAEPFVDLRDRVRFGGEQGLLGLAFHPAYATNGRVFVNYTRSDGATVVSELARVEGCACADRASERVLLTIAQPFANHNGGMLAFGPDGYLYVSTGDGGGGGDPLGAGQDLTTLLGKTLRIDVDGQSGDRAYAIPPDNPFADGEGGALPEIWAYGLRNPWRITFDRQTGDLFIADVGQRSWEEVNAEPAGEGGRNYGWNVMEGPECFARDGCDQSGMTLPIAWYARTDGRCAVTGGYVYRGSAVAGLAGTYLFSDYCSGTVWAIDAAAAVAGEQQEPRVVAESGASVTGFGEDEAGEMYLVTAEGQVLRVASAP